MSKKYFANNWEKYRKIPSDHYDSIPFDIFMDWKIDGWELQPAYEAIVRARNCKTGKVSEYVYKSTNGLKKKLKQLMDTQEAEVTLATHDTIQHLKPTKYITEDEKDKYS
mgnify:CR=1 FL=1